MRVDVYPILKKIPEDRFYGKTVVVVHALRSVTAMIWAIKNGARQIVPVCDAARAVAMSGILATPDCLLAGEQDGKMPSGFHLNNSPTAYTKAAVQDKTIIISSSNSSSVLMSADSAKHVLLGAMINRTAVAKKLLEYDDDAVLICTGSDNEVAAEDLICAGAILNALQNLALKASIGISESDMSFVCRTLYRDWKMKDTDLSSVKSIKALLMRGCKSDVEFCLTADMTDIVPEYSGGIIE